MSKDLIGRPATPFTAATGMVLGLMILFPGDAQANAIGAIGILPSLNIVLQPAIILVETLVLGFLLDQGFWPTLWKVTLANIASLVAGFLLVAVVPAQIATRVALWQLIEPVERRNRRLPLRTLMLLTMSMFVFWLVSWLIESLVLGHLEHYPSRFLAEPVALANCVSYFLLAIFAAWHLRPASGSKPGI